MRLPNRKNSLEVANIMSQTIRVRNGCIGKAYNVQLTGALLNAVAIITGNKERVNSRLSQMVPFPGARVLGITTTGVASEGAVFYDQAIERGFRDIENALWQQKLPHDRPFATVVYKAIARSQESGRS